MKWDKLTLSTLLCFLTIGVFANSTNNYEETERISKSYAVSEGAYVEINNKYGSIEHVVWDKDSIKIEVEMVFTCENFNDLADLKELFDINFEGNRNFILAETNWSEDVNIFKKGLVEIQQGVGSAKNLEINYTIYSRNNLELELTNKFGNIFMGDYHGSLKVELSYGDFRARHLSNLNQLKVSYGKVKVKRIDQGRLDFSSVKPADIDEVKDVIIKSSASEIEIEDVEIVNLNSKHDEIVFEKAQRITGDLVLSDLEVDLLSQAMGTNSKFGSIRIKEIGSDATDINLNGNRTDFRIGFATYFSGDIAVTVSKEVDFIHPDEFQVSMKKTNSDGLHESNGTIGSPSGTKITIYAVNGYVEIDN